MIGPLVDPGPNGDAFHVVCPSLPGFSFSGKPADPGWGPPRIARAWAELMARLGYDRYGAQGGDWGSGVTSSLAEQYPDRLVGIHLNFAPVGPPIPVPDDLTDAERRTLADFAQYRGMGHGLFAATGDPAADPRLRPGRLTGRAVCVDRGKVQGLDGSRRRSVLGTHP